MSDQEWRDEAKTLKNTLLRHIDIIQGFSERAFQFIPGFTARLEAEEIFERLLSGIETLSGEKDNLVTENKELRLAKEKIYYDADIIDRFCACAMECFPHLQKRYEVCRFFLYSLNYMDWWPCSPKYRVSCLWISCTLTLKVLDIFTVAI
jgi:hypothetical protein